MLWRSARPVDLALVALLAASGAIAAEKARPGKSPHVEILARAEVVTAPRRTVRKNGRKLLEFEVTLDAYLVAPEQPAGADRNVPVDMQGRIKVVHDLSCGGDDPALAKGDRVELQGEYVDVAGGPDLIRFTHAAGGKGCGIGEAHPGGYLRKIVPVTPTPAVTPPRPAGIVPDQPFVGTPAAGEKPHAAILKMKEAGASDDALLEAIRSGKKSYPLSTYDIQQLRAAGVSSGVIEAMLQSGRAAVTPRPTPAATPSP